jgi:cytochrome P450
MSAQPAISLPVPAPPPPAASTLPQPPGPRLPRHLLGAWWLLREHDLLERCRRRYGDVFSLSTWPFGPLVVICDPRIVKQVFAGDPKELHAGEGNSFTLPVAGPESILLLDEERHMHRRKLMLPPLHGQRLGVYDELIRRLTDAEIDRWQPGRELQIHAALQKVTLSVILRVLLGIEDAEQCAELERLLPKLINSPALMWPPLRRDLGSRSPWRRFLELRSRVDELLYAEIARKRADPRLSEREDILSLLVQARDEMGESMSDCELRDQLVTLLLAGHETSASALAWSIERLVRNPAVLARLREELARGDEGYLECVIKETLRSRPVVPVAMRSLTRTAQIGGYALPAGTLLCMSTILMHNHTDHFPEPERFSPERFADKQVEAYTWIPFGGGVRRCLGASFAMFEMKAILRRLLERCELKTLRPKPERARRRFITYPPDRGARVYLSERRGGGLPETIAAMQAARTTNTLAATGEKARV